MEQKEPTTPKKSGARKWGEKTVQGVIVGRDKTVVPPEEVQQLASIGCKDTEIAAWFGINENTLRFNFSVELTKGRESMKISLRRQMFDNALRHNNTVMQIFLSKNYLGMSDNPVDAEANTPLPWVESDETTDMQIEAYEGDELETDQDTEE